LIKNPLDKFPFHVMNNPFASTIDIQFARIPDSKVEIRLMDMQGKLLRKWSLNQVTYNRIRLQVGDDFISHAYYVVDVLIGNKEYVDEIMKK
jgi:hypothetical protein